MRKANQFILADFIFRVVVSILTVSIYWHSMAYSADFIDVKTLYLKNIFNAKSDWHVSAYNIEERKDLYYETTNTPAKICFWVDVNNKQDICFLAEDGLVKYPKVEELKIIELSRSKTNKQGILFISTRLDAVEPIHRVAIYVYDREQDMFIDALPSVYLYYQGECRIINTIQGDPVDIFVIANRMWRGGEEGLYDSHNYRISIYEYTEDGKYISIGEYITKTKYKHYGNTRKKNVISREMGNIENYIVGKKQYNRGIR